MKAIIFDFDGVIVDSEQYWPLYENKELESIIPEWSAEDQSTVVGMNFPTVYEYIVKKYSIDMSLEEFEIRANVIANKVYAQTKLTEGFLEFYEECKQYIQHMAIATSSRHAWIDPVMDRLQIANYFEVISTSDHVPLDKAKPDPAIYQLASTRLGIAPEHCIAIEDSKNGITSAKKAGMYVVGITNNLDHGQDLSQADMIVATFSDIDLQTLLR